MQAAVLTEINKPLVICEVETTPLAIGQVLVRVLVSGICGSQLHEICGNKGNARFLPHLMGHEGCGIVEEIGPGVREVSIGDKVVMHWRPGRGIESEFPRYVMKGREFSSGKVNTLTEYAIVSENRLTRVPQDTNAEFAALLGCSMTTALGLIDNESELKFGESVLVLGCGGVGLNVIFAARLRGAGVVVGYDANEEKFEIVSKHGADYFYFQKEKLGRSFDVIVDTTGDSSLISWAIERLSPRGRLRLVGQPRPGEGISIKEGLQLFRGEGLSISASQGGRTRPSDDIPRYLNLMESGRLGISALITHKFSLGEVNVAFDVLRTGLAGRIMITME